MGPERNEIQLLSNTAAKGSGLNWKFPSFLKNKETQYALLIRNQALMVSFMSRCYCHGQHMMKLVDYEKFLISKNSSL